MNLKKGYYEEQDIALMLEKFMFKNDYTQTELSEVIGISKQYLNDFLRGRRSVPNKVLEFLKLEKKDIYIPS